MSTMRCLAEPETCSWTYRHERQVIVDAAWRQHYAQHLEGRRALEAYTRAGSVHPVVRPGRAILTTPTTQPHTR